MRTSILQAINNINEHRNLAGEGLTAVSVAYLAKMYTGEVAPIIQTNP
jgi:hypothetical protein